MAAGFVNAGEMQWRVSLQAVVEVKDAYGELIESRWDTVATYWAKLETLTGFEAVNSAQIKPGTSHKLTMNYVPSGTPGVPGISPNNRLIYKSRTFNITYVNNIEEQNRQLAVFCMEIVTP